MNLKMCSVSLLALTVIAGSAAAQDAPISWTGPYAGVNIGGAFNTTCATWTPTVPEVSTVFTGNGCPNNASFIGGVQAGFNYQAHSGFVIGLEADVSGGTSVSSSISRTTVGNEFIPGGTYTASGSHTPGAIETVRLRLGWAFDRTLISYKATGGGAFRRQAQAPGTISFHPRRRYVARRDILRRPQRHPHRLDRRRRRRVQTQLEMVDPSRRPLHEPRFSRRAEPLRRY